MVKIYEAESVNGSAPDDEEFAEEHDYSTLFKAPSYSEFIKTPANPKARYYELRVQSMMKAGMVTSLNTHQWPDAATFLKHGPGFAKAAGNLAAVDAKAAAIVEMLTAPNSPYIMFAMVAMPFISQLARNHQGMISEVTETARQRRKTRKAEKKAGIVKDRKPPITVHLGKRAITIPVRFRFKVPNVKKLFNAFLAPTQHPQEIAAEVFNDEAVIKALHKIGLYPQRGPDDEG